MALASSRKVARPCIPAGLRIYAVGDVHGRADLLAPLLARIDADLSAHPIAQPCQVFLGDYIDRGPHSRQVIDLLIARRRRHRMLFLKGNHEDFALEFLSDPTKLSEWKQVGGLSTLLSYGVKIAGRTDPAAEIEAGDRVSSGIALEPPPLPQKPCALISLWGLFLCPCRRAARNPTTAPTPAGPNLDSGRLPLARRGFR